MSSGKQPQQRHSQQHRRHQERKLEEKKKKKKEKKEKKREKEKENEHKHAQQQLLTHSKLTRDENKAWWEFVVKLKQLFLSLMKKLQGAEYLSVVEGVCEWMKHNVLHASKEKMEYFSMRVKEVVQQMYDDAVKEVSSTSGMEKPQAEIVVNAAIAVTLIAAGTGLSCYLCAVITGVETQTVAARIAWSLWQGMQTLPGQNVLNSPNNVKIAEIIQKLTQEILSSENSQLLFQETYNASSASVDHGLLAIVYLGEFLFTIDWSSWFAYDDAESDDEAGNSGEVAYGRAESSAGNGDSGEAAFPQARSLQDHSMVAQLALLSRASYEKDEDNLSTETKEWTRDASASFKIESTDQPSFYENIKCVVFHSTTSNISVLAFRGTEFTSIRNWLFDAIEIGKPLHRNFLSSRLVPSSDREGFYSRMRKELETVKAKFSGRTLIATGHSLGGWLAQLSALYLRSSLVTFNAPSLQRTTEIPSCFISAEELPLAWKEMNGNCEIEHHRLMYDIVSQFPHLLSDTRKHVVMTHRTPPEVTSSSASTRDIIFKSHAIELLSDTFKLGKCPMRGDRKTCGCPTQYGIRVGPIDLASHGVSRLMKIAFSDA